MTLHCSNCQTELPGGARFCMNCGQPVGQGAPAGPANGAAVRLAAAAPAPLIEKVRAAAHLSGERRTVTAVYMDVVRSTALQQHIGQAAFGELLNSMLDFAYPIVYRYEGTIAHLQDDELLVCFPYRLVPGLTTNLDRTVYAQDHS